MAAAGLLLGIVWFFGAYRWLAPQAPIQAKFLVVEGWLPDYALEAAIREYRRGGYEQLFTTGGPLEQGSYLKEFQTYAELARNTLLRLGLSTNEVKAVPNNTWQRNRTFAAALALGDHCQRSGIALTAINLVSVGPHTRRSGLCFRRALGRNVEVGLIAIDTQDYDVDRWWKFSQGVKDVVGETFSVAYAWLSVDYGR
ncbi:MAG: YdcF family protein [Verrucomicrobiales bacterium]|nr:YdcF family protein [Verrucomicrobiales bacterium]